MTTTDLIDRSISHTEIVTAEYDYGTAIELHNASEGFVEANDDLNEYWGTREDGSEWRVHLTGCPRGLHNGPPKF